MIVSLHWDLREHLHELRKDDKDPKIRRDARFYVLTYLAMRANLRLRCWPSTKSICKDTGYSQPIIVEARNWLIEHQAIVPVPYEKRVGDEEKLPVRQMVYQLTGILKLTTGIVPYIAMPPEVMTSVMSELEAIGGEVVAIKTSLAKTLVAKPKGIESSQGIEEKITAPNGTANQPAANGSKKKAEPDQWDAAISKALKTTATGFVTQVKGMMFGRGKKGTEWAACNFDPPVTEVQEIIEFGVYVEQRMRREKITIKLSKPLTIQRWFYDFRAAKKPAESKILTLDVSAADYPDAADFLPLDEFGNYRLEGA